MKPVGSFEALTEQDRRTIREWFRSERAAKLLQEATEEVRRESEDFRKRTMPHPADAHRVFGNLFY